MQKGIQKFFLLLIFLPMIVNGQKSFVHPGLSHKKSDLDRMKNMVEAKIDPWYSSYQNMTSINTASYDYVVQGNTSLTEVYRDSPRTNKNIFEEDSRAAYYNALRWYIEGDERHAQKAVECLNAWTGLTYVQHNGTTGLTSNLIIIMLEAAELMKNTYPGWSASDIQAFKDMLVYPGYSDTTIPQNESTQGTWYWRAYKFEPVRAGNQELCAIRTTLALGIFLDNEKIYDRALRYVSKLPGRQDDIPFPVGPHERVEELDRNTYRIAYSINELSTEPNFYGNGALTNYVWENGQCQESSRDQGHTSFGMGLLCSIGEIAWNQSDDLWGFTNDRILLGLEYSLKYNVSYVQSYTDQPEPWEPTAESGEFLQYDDATLRTKSLAICPVIDTDTTRLTRGTFYWEDTWELPIAHYVGRGFKTEDDAKWTVRARDYSIMANGRFETGPSGGAYVGFGGLSFRRPEGCYGDPIVGFDSEGLPDYSMNELPGTIEAENFDYSPTSSEGRVYHDASASNTGGEYRTDEAVDIIASSEGGYNLTGIETGEWVTYTIGIPVGGTFDLSIRYAAANGDGRIKFNIGGEDKTLNVAIPFGSPNSTGLTDWKDLTVANDIELSAGVFSMKVLFDGASDAFDLNSITFEQTSIEIVCEDAIIPPADIISGINYSYYEGEWTSLPNFEELTPLETGLLTNIDLSPAKVTDNFALMYEGYLNVESEGDYTFYLASDDGSKLYIGDREIVSNDGIHNADNEVSGTWCLETGYHPIRVEYFEASGGESLSVSYEGPETSKTSLAGLYGDYIKVPLNSALSGTATQSSSREDGPASNAIDGNTNGVYSGGSVTHTNGDEENPWWQVDLGEEKTIEEIVIFNRTDCCGERLTNFSVSVLDSEENSVFTQSFTTPPSPSLPIDVGSVLGQIVKVELAAAGTLSLAEVQVFAGEFTKRNQRITFDALPAKQLGDADFAPGAASSSELLIVYTSSNTAVATIIEGNIHIEGVGISTITASQSGDDEYNAAEEVSQELTVSNLSQIITFNALPTKQVGDADFSPGATASSGLTVTYTSSDTDVATIIEGNIHIVGSGISTITASQAGDNNYGAALTISQTLVVNSDAKMNQVITFVPFATKQVGDPDFSIESTADSDLPISSYTSSNVAVATIVDGTIHIEGAGTTTITALQEGNETYNPAVGTQVLTVNQLAQTITFNTLPVKKMGDADFSPGATASSGLTVEYTSSDQEVATIVSGNVHIIGVGTSTITASQEGDASYSAATGVTQELTVNKQDQVITFEALPSKEFGDADFAPGAVATSGLAVSYSSANTNVATIVEGNIHIVGVGTSTITAFQEGNETYNSAEATQTLTVVKTSQNITFSTLPVKAEGDPDFAPGATATSGLEVSYTSSDTEVATIVDGNIHIVGTGISMITASQAGDGIYNAADDVTQNLAVLPGNTLSTADDLNSISIHPNPVLDILQVEFENDSYDEYVIYNINGQVVKSSVIKKGVKELNIDFENLTKGMYLLKFSGGQSVKTFKMMKN